MCRNRIAPRALSSWLSCLLLALLLNPVSAAEPSSEGPYEPTWESLCTAPVPQWFDDAKLGIFIHWGAYSVAGSQPLIRGYAEHFPKRLYRNAKRFYPYMEATFGGHPPEFGYKDLIPLYKAEKWDPEAWADLFVKAGARYVIPVGEHHDGFAMWDSDLTQWDAVDMGPKRDVIGELAEAVRARGLKYGVSYHRERHHGFFGQRLHRSGPPHADIAEEIRRHPKAAGLYGPFELDDAFMQDYVARWKEITAKYHPDFLWIDHQPAPVDELTLFREYCVQMIADYLNQAAERGQPVYFNNKGGRANWPAGCGCREMDNLRRERIGPKWQNPATMGTSYGYLELEEKHDSYKSPEELIRLLSDIVSKNGNLLLNIGPRADGTIPPGVEGRLLALGEWLEANGEAIYGTRPWTTFGQEKPELRFTTKPDALYLIAFQPRTKPLSIEATADWKKDQVQGVTVLATGETLEWQMTEQGLSIVPPEGGLPANAVLKIRTRLPEGR